jgi:hypothetical protein
MQRRHLGRYLIKDTIIIVSAKQPCRSNISITMYFILHKRNSLVAVQHVAVSSQLSWQLVIPTAGKGSILRLKATISL